MDRKQKRHGNQAVFWVRNFPSLLHHHHCQFNVWLIIFFSFKLFNLLHNFIQLLFSTILQFITLAHHFPIAQWMKCNSVQSVPVQFLMNDHICASNYSANMSLDSGPYIIYNEGWSSQFAHRVECSMSFSSGTWISTTWLFGLCIFCTYPETKQYIVCLFATSTHLQVQCLRSYLHWMSVWKPKSVSWAAFLFTCIIVNNINIGNLQSASETLMLSEHFTT